MNTTGPVRMCAACRTRCPQGALVRVARRPDGCIAIDAGAQRSMGRGVYLCPSKECILLAERRRALSRALQADIPAELFSALIVEAERRNNCGSYDEDHPASAGNRESE